MLFIILADRLGLASSASITPHHLFVKYLDEASGRTYNLEATSGAHVTRDSWYREKMPMTDAAIAKGIYMRPLTKRETLALMATTILEHYRAIGRHETTMALADLVLAAYPEFANAIVFKGSAAGYLLDERFIRRYPMPTDIPPGLYRAYETLVEINRSAFERAEALGWRPAE